MAKRPLFTGFIVFLILAAAFFLGTYFTALLVERQPHADNQIALVRVEGVILDADEPVAQLREFAENESIRAILIRIDSPGGAVVPSQEIYDQVRKIRAEGRQKVVVSMGSVDVGEPVVTTMNSPICAATAPLRFSGSLGSVDHSLLAGS